MNMKNIAVEDNAAGIGLIQASHTSQDHTFARAGWAKKGGNAWWRRQFKLERKIFETFTQPDVQHGHLPQYSARQPTGRN